MNSIHNNHLDINLMSWAAITRPKWPCRVTSAGVTGKVSGSEKVRNVLLHDLIQRDIVRQAQG